MSTYPVILPAPRHNGWAKGPGRVHASSSVGNLSEDQWQEHLEEMLDKFSFEIMGRTRDVVPLTLKSALARKKLVASC